MFPKQMIAVYCSVPSKDGIEPKKYSASIASLLVLLVSSACFFCIILRNYWIWTLKKGTIYIDDYHWQTYVYIYIYISISYFPTIWTRPFLFGQVTAIQYPWAPHLHQTPGNARNYGLVTCFHQVGQNPARGKLRLSPPFLKCYQTKNWWVKFRNPHTRQELILHRICRELNPMQAQLDEMQVRAICVQIAYHSKLGVSSLSGDSKNAHHSPALTRPMRSFTSIQMFHTHTHPARRGQNWGPDNEMKMRMTEKWKWDEDEDEMKVT